MKVFGKILLSIFFLFLNACTSMEANVSDGKVVAIADGDTFTLLNAQNQQIRVRLYGIDAPEGGQDFGKASRQKLSALIFGQNVKIDVQDKDRYERTVAIVYNAKGENVNEAMLREGLAWHYKQYDQNPAWADLELQAQRAKRGLWSGENLLPPWNWRKQKRVFDK